MLRSALFVLFVGGSSQAPAEPVYQPRPCEVVVYENRGKSRLGMVVTPEVHDAVSCHPLRDQGFDKLVYNGSHVCVEFPEYGGVATPVSSVKKLPGDQAHLAAAVANTVMDNLRRRMAEKSKPVDDLNKVVLERYEHHCGA